MERELVSHDCKGLCEWQATGEKRSGRELFCCRGCGSEWTAELAWTPANADGSLADEVKAARGQSRHQDDASSGHHLP